MKEIFYKTLIEIKYRIYKYMYPNPNVINRVETSEMIASNKSLSLVRFGDGELGQILNQIDIGFQKYNIELADRLKSIILAEEDRNILICIPNVFNDVSNLKNRPRFFWEEWIVNNKAILCNLLKSKKYGDSLVSRLYLPWKDTSNEITVVDNLKKTWCNKSVVIVEGAKTRWGVGNDLLAETKSIKRILCPAENAFDKYDEIFNACMKYSEFTDIFILALGPTATVLAFDLAKQGIRALDLGHFDLQYEYLMRQSEERVEIPTKYNNETMNTNVETCTDNSYLESIVFDLS